MPQISDRGRWQDGKHGVMGVKCVVCHGSTDKNFIGKT